MIAGPTSEPDPECGQPDIPGATASSGHPRGYEPPSTALPQLLRHRRIGARGRNEPAAAPQVAVGHEHVPVGEPAAPVLESSRSLTRERRLRCPPVPRDPSRRRTPHAEAAMAQQGSSGNPVKVVAIIAVVVLVALAAWLFMGQRSRKVTTSPAASEQKSGVQVEVNLPDTVTIKP